MGRDLSINTAEANHAGGQQARTTRRLGWGLRTTLGALLAFGALNAFGGGYYGAAGAEGVPLEWLEGSPFRDYFIPSLVLMFVVGGALLSAAVAVFAGWSMAPLLAAGAGLVVLVWLAVQLSIIGFVSWMQPATALGAIGILVLVRATEWGPRDGG